MNVFHPAMDERYLEKPRPNLYNVITKLKERHGPAPSKVLLMFKVNERKKEEVAQAEKEIEGWFSNFVEEHEMTGLCLIVNQYILHFIEADRDNMKLILEAINQEVASPDSFYIWCQVVSHMDDCPQRTYKIWNVKNTHISGQGGDVLKDKEPCERAWIVLSVFENIGVKVNDNLDKGNTGAIVKTIKSGASEQMPSADELSHLASEANMTLPEYIRFYHSPPDIQMEGEKCWPPEPDHEYHFK